MRGCLLVDNEGYVRMKLKRRSSDGGGNRAFDSPRDCVSFYVSAGQDENSARLLNRSNAHGDGTLGDFFAGDEGLAIVFDRLAGENFQPGPRSQARRRFVEANVAIAPDTKNLQVDATRCPDFLFVRRTILFVIAGNHSIRNVSSRWVDVDMAEEILAHKKVEALRGIRRNPEVLLEIKSSYI